MKSKADIETINTVLASDKTEDKHVILDELESYLPECDIFPFSILLPALADADSVVREKTLSLLRYCNKGLSDEDSLQILRMIKDRDEGVRLIALETITSVAGNVKSEILGEVLPYLWHRDVGVRETAAQLFAEFSYQITEDMFMQVAEEYGMANVSAREAIADFLERNGHFSLIYT